MGVLIRERVAYKDGGKPGKYASTAEFITTWAGVNGTLAQACAAYGVGYPGIAGQQYYCDGVGLTIIGRPLPANICSIGDSIASFNVDLGIGANYPNAASEGFLTWFNNLRYGAHYIQNVAASGAVIGDVTDNVGNTATTQIYNLKSLALKPKAVFLSIGANDFYALSYTAKQVIANLHGLLAEFTALNIDCYFLNGFPRENSTVGSNVYSAPKQAEQLAFLQLLPDLFSKYNRHKLLDVYSIASSTGDITGGAASGWTYDGLHPNQKYAKAIGEYLHIVLPVSENLIYPSLISDQDISGVVGGRSKNVSARSTMSAYSNGVGVPAGFSEDIKTNCTSVIQIQNNTHGGAYKEIQITLTFSAAGSYLLSNIETGALITDTDKWVSTGKVSLDSDANSIVKHVYLRGRCEGATLKMAYGGYARGTAAAPGVMPSVAPFSNKFVCTAIGSSAGSSTGFRNSIGVDTTGAGTVVITVSELAMFRMPAIVNYS